MTPVGTWRAVVRGWRVFVPVLVGLIAVQTLLLLPDPVPALSWGFLALTVGSLLAVVLATSLTAGAAVAATSGGELRWRPTVFGWALLTGLLTAVVAVAELPLTPVVLLLAIPGLPALACGAPVLAGYRHIARLPWRYLFAALATVVLMVLTWVLAALLGLFVTGLLAAVAIWLWLGLGLIVLLCLFSSLYLRAAGDSGGRQPDTQPV